VSTPGWYPDPSGAPGRFRYWDGRAWSQQTTDRPGPRPRRRIMPFVIGAVALVVVVGVIIVFAVRQLGGSRPITNAPVPTSTVSGWDDSSPTAEPSPSREPSPSPTPTPSGRKSTAPLRSCPDGDPLLRRPRPNDSRVHGGGLSFPRVPGWEDDLQTRGLSWAYDVSSQSKRLEPNWLSVVAVGELRTADGFTAPKQAAQSIVQCVSSSYFYSHFESATERKSERTEVDGRDAWWIRTDIRVDDPNVEAEGDTVDVIVVDLGDPDRLGMYLGAGSIGDRPVIKILDDTIRGLRVD